MTAIAELSQSHQQRLAWFADRAGQTTFYPTPLEDGSFLVTRPKGIYKPQDLEYALSVRINLDSRYADGEVLTRTDASWFFNYHQENKDPAARDREYTNRGLMACLRDAVAVGVLRERAVPNGARSEYDVLGLAVPVAWQEGYFFFESLVGPPVAARGDTPSEVLVRLAEQENQDEQDHAPPPRDDYDARLRVQRQITARRGQAGFRRGLMAAYGGRCAATGCAVTAVLEAAHLRPYRGPESNTVTNGLLLRADLHTLLDLQLIAIEPAERRVVISKQLVRSDYADLHGKPLLEPLQPSQRPAEVVLLAMFSAFMEAEGRR